MHPACNPHRRCQNSVQATRTGGADAGKSACTSVQGAARCKEMPLHLGAGAGRPELNRLNARCDLALCVALLCTTPRLLASLIAGVTDQSTAEGGDDRVDDRAPAYVAITRHRFGKSWTRTPDLRLLSRALYQLS